MTSRIKKHQVRNLATGLIAALALATVPATSAATPPVIVPGEFSCWERGAYLDGGGFGHKSVCNAPHSTKVVLKRDGTIVDSYTSSRNYHPAPNNWVDWKLTAVPHFGYGFRCGSTYQVVVTAYRQLDGAALYWTSGAPRKMC